MISTQHTKDFLKVFNSLCTSRQSWQVWADWISATACCLSISVDHERDRYKQRSEEFRQCMDRIGNDKKAQEMFDIMVNALEADPGQDFLGEILRIMVGACPGQAEAEHRPGHPFDLFVIHSGSHVQNPFPFLEASIRIMSG